MGEHHLVARPVQRDHVGDQLGRMLPVAVERHRGIALDSVEPRGEGRLMPEVAAQLQDRHAGVVGRQLRKLCPGVVHGAVVDVVDPDVILASQRRHDVHQPAVELGHDLLFVVQRDDDVDREPPLVNRHVASPHGRPPTASAGAPAIRTRRSYGRSPLDRSGSR